MKLKKKEIAKKTIISSYFSLIYISDQTAQNAQTRDFDRTQNANQISVENFSRLLLSDTCNILKYLKRKNWNVSFYLRCNCMLLYYIVLIQIPFSFVCIWSLCAKTLTVECGDLILFQSL